MELELTVKTNSGKTEVHRCAIYTYSYRLPIAKGSSEICLDVSIYEALPDFLLRMAVGEYQSVDAAITDAPSSAKVVFRIVTLANQLYESGSCYPGSVQVNSSLSLSAESCTVGGVEFHARKEAY